ncbi:MAG: LuxR C-terminal-related transcriptional regulator [Sphaerotilus natans subsp. sulfidivorans]|uniref:LuxR C-terminal-related transcriptional regulator n=1 Tax=Sphaerotilus sulfidivorans TaxID=639200 RepID=UPI00235802B2|nr:LuxR C-terminal-related transcriptional regulator [Sphaerotilus sulfidivorans]MCK6401322.1 LuxR C-terminal-related transcriptional regulator [Sphaerotilus sulfidivorans]
MRTAWLDLHDLDVAPQVLSAHLDELLRTSDRVPQYIFIDGLEGLGHTPAAAVLARHIDASERTGWPDVRWLLAARRRPRLPLARWRADGQLLEWSATDLALDTATSSALLVRAAGRPLSATELSVALRWAEGWPTGLRLLGHGLSTPSANDPTDQCPVALAQYFDEEVCASLDHELRAWLPALGALSRFTAPLCDAVTGRSDSQELIARFHGAGGFVTPLDTAGRSWRLHPLFAAFAARQLGIESGRHAQVHRRASCWFQVQSQVNEALDHAERSGDAGFLAETLDRCWDTVNREGNFSRMIRLAQTLSKAQLERQPMLTLWQALYLTVERRFEQAERLLDQVERDLVRHVSASEETGALHYTLAHRRLSLALFRDDFPACERHSEQLKALGPSPDPYLLGLAQLAEVAIGRHRWRLLGCEAPAFAAQALFMDLGHRPGLVWHACLVGPVLMQRGQVNGAAVHYRRAVAEAAALPCGDPANELVSMPLSLLAEAQLEQGDLDAARETFARAMVSLRAIGPLDASAALLIGRARLACHDGDAATAQMMLDRAQALAQARGFERLRWMVLNERVRIRLSSGDVKGAHAAAVEGGLPEAEGALMAQPDAPLAREAQALARARLWLSIGKPALALRLARSWVQFGIQQGSVSTAVRAGLLCAQALLDVGESRAAQRAATHALTQAGDGGMVFTFVEATAAVQALLLAAEDVAPISLRIRLQSLLGSKAEERVLYDSPTEALNSREAEVLRQVAGGLLYKEIGTRLGLTEGSVKWYMQQVYSKLGVRRRLAAVERGRTLGYL